MLACNNCGCQLKRIRCPEVVDAQKPDRSLSDRFHRLHFLPTGLERMEPIQRASHRGGWHCA